MAQTKPLWMVRAGRGGDVIEEFLSKNIVGIGWKLIGPVEPGTPREEIERRIQETYPDNKKLKTVVHTSIVKRFVDEIANGDTIVTYDPNQRIYYLGTVQSAVRWRDTPPERARDMEWTSKVERDRLKAPTRNSLGSIATLFRPSDDAAEELRQKAIPIEDEFPPLEPKTPDVDEEPEGDEGSIFKDVVAKAEQFIEDRIARLDWDEVQELVAGILRAMGYRTKVADPGPDRGIDIFASPDGLGLESPRIFVEVKHRQKTSIGAPDVRAFLGGRKDGDRCLYVSTGGFTREARYEAERAQVPLTLLSLPELRELLVEHYDNLDAQTTALVPLARVFWPTD